MKNWVNVDFSDSRWLCFDFCCLSQPLRVFSEQKINLSLLLLYLSFTFSLQMLIWAEQPLLSSPKTGEETLLALSL